MKILLLTLVPLLVLMLLWAMCRSSPSRVDRCTVSDLDVERYVGVWYEIARFDHSFERGLAEVRAEYRFRPDGQIEVINSGLDLQRGDHREAHGKAHVSSVPGRLRVSFFWIFYSDYNVLELDEAYQWVLVGSHSPKYLWILSRTPQLPPSTLNHILELARIRGYDTKKFLFIAQSPTYPPVVEPLRSDESTSDR